MSDDNPTESNQDKTRILELGKQPGNVSQACKVLGYSRDWFYGFKDRCKDSTTRDDLKKLLLRNRVSP